VQKRSSHKESLGGRKAATRVARATGTIVEELVHPAGHIPDVDGVARPLMVPLVRGGQTVADTDLTAARTLVASGLKSLPWEGLKLSHGEPAIPTRVVAP